MKIPIRPAQRIKPRQKVLAIKGNRRPKSKNAFETANYIRCSGTKRREAHATSAKCRKKTHGETRAKNRFFRDVQSIAPKVYVCQVSWTQTFRAGSAIPPLPSLPNPTTLRPLRSQPNCNRPRRQHQPCTSKINFSTFLNSY